MMRQFAFTTHGIFSGIASVVAARPLANLLGDVHERHGVS